MGKERIYMEKQRKIREEKEAIERKKTEIPMRLRSLCNDDFFRNSHIKASHIETIAFNASIEEIKSILNKESKEQQLKQFDVILVIAKKAKKEKKRAEKEKKKRENLEKERKSGKQWTDNELTLLVNAVGRYPGGTMDRWLKIQKTVGKHRSVDEIISKVKDLTKKGRNKKTKGGDKGNKNEENVDENVWSKEQQSALEKALRAVRTLPANEKWDKVEQMVPGKTKKQCVERFKWIRAQLQAQKQKK